MNLNDLPDLCLRLIFDRLPLLDLLSIRLVCSNWNTLHWIILRKRRSLTLLIGNEASLSPITSQCSIEVPFINDFIDFESQRFASTRQHGTEHIKLDKLLNVDTILERLPNLTSLSIVFSKFNCEMLENTSILLEHLSSQLERVQVWYWFADVNDRNDPLELKHYLSRQIELLSHSMPALKHLTFYLHNYAFHDNENIYGHLPLAESLEEFYYNQDNCPQSLAQWISENGQENYHLKRVGISDCIGEKLFNELVHIQSQVILQSIEYLKIDYDQEYIQPYDDLFRLLTSLKVLELQVQHAESGFSMLDLAKSLSPLKQLHHLRLNIKYFYFGLLLQKDENKQSPEIGQLPSVKALTLDINTGTHCDGHSKHWARIFPNVALIRLNHYFAVCGHCGWDICEIDPPDEVKEKCTRKLLNTFRHFDGKCSVLTNQRLLGQLTVGDLQVSDDCA